MKKKIWIILGIVLIVIAIIIAIITHRKREIREFDFPKTVNVNNFSDSFRADTIAMVITHLIMGYDTIYIDIYNLDSKLSTIGYDVIGFIQRTGEPHSYQIFLRKTSSEFVMELLSHELIHLDQMEKGELFQPLGNKKYVIYKNDTIWFEKTPYYSRSYEIDAFSRQEKIDRKLKNLLYKK